MDLKKLLLLTGWLLYAAALMSQQTISQRDMIAITPVVSDELAVNSGIRKTLETKARQMLTKNGAMASFSERFVLVPNITESSKNVTATAPPMFAIEMDVSFYIVDVVEQTVMGEISFQVTGVHRNEHEAYIHAINQINVGSVEAKAFVNRSREKIIAYYNTQIPTIIRKAGTLSSQQLYDEALMLLYGVPECVEGYPAVADEMTKTYRKMLNHDADVLLSEAKGFAAERNFGAALDALVKVDPFSDRYATARAQIESIRRQIDAIERAAFEVRMTEIDAKREAELRKEDNDIVKLEIRAARDVAVAKSVADAYASNNSLMAGVNRWFKSLFH
ncbi:MAG: hypothetical protein LBJ23_04905 [Tannerella sp.]|jgi:hypothetical protein|nr:hypothetical protein [Tannerella sp.]